MLCLLRHPCSAWGHRFTLLDVRLVAVAAEGPECCAPPKCSSSLPTPFINVGTQPPIRAVVKMLTNVPGGRKYVLQRWRMRATRLIPSSFISWRKRITTGGVQTNINEIVVWRLINTGVVRTLSSLLHDTRLFPRSPEAVCNGR